MFNHEQLTTDLRGPVTCAVCGCRLTEVPGLEGTAWRHFQVVTGEDARGCRPACLTDLHRRDGTVLPSLESLMRHPRAEDTAAA